jgi:hypothetical protein
MALEGTHDLLFPPVEHKLSFNHEKFFPVAYILGSDGVEITLPEGEVIDGIEHIGLPPSVVPDKTIDLRIEFKCDVAEVLVVEEGNFSEKHEKRYSNGFTDPTDFKNNK